MTSPCITNTCITTLLPPAKLMYNIKYTNVKQKIEMLLLALWRCLEAAKQVANQLVTCGVY